MPSLRGVLPWRDDAAISHSLNAKKPLHAILSSDLSSPSYVLYLLAIEFYAKWQENLPRRIGRSRRQIRNQSCFSFNTLNFFVLFVTFVVKRFWFRPGPTKSWLVRVRIFLYYYAHLLSVYAHARVNCKFLIFITHCKIITNCFTVQAVFLHTLV